MIMFNSVVNVDDFSSKTRSSSKEFSQPSFYQKHYLICTLLTLIRVSLKLSDDDEILSYNPQHTQLTFSIKFIIFP